jgi:hypothetical protein
MNGSCHAAHGQELENCVLYVMEMEENKLEKDMSEH